jgi:hypothetical protein
MVRTNAIVVEELLGFNYATVSQPSLTPYIDTASEIVDQLIIDANAISVSIGATRAELIERWLACYWYTKMDPLYKGKGTDKASGQFVRGEKDYLEAAIALDPSGLLVALMSQQTASGRWGGKTDIEALTYRQRME